ncbi:MAG: hypothetical protein ACLU9S_21610 [Oscillospiraceae bacterium]
MRTPLSRSAGQVRRKVSASSSGTMPMEIAPDQLIQDRQIVAALHGGVGGQTEETGPETGGFALSSSFI